MWTVEPKEGARKPDGSEYTPTDLRTIQDWIVRPQLRNIAGRHRDQHHRRVFETVPCHARPGQADELRLEFPRCVGSAGQKQRQCRCRLHREKRRAVPDTRAGPGGDSRGDPRHRHPHRARCADPRQGSGRSVARQRVAHRRRHRERPRSGAGHGVHADGREQPHGVAAGGGQARGDQPARCRKGWWRRRSTTAPPW